MSLLKRCSRTLVTFCSLLLLSVALHAAEQPVAQATVASAHPAATVAGLETLAGGGNAFDAAVAVAAALAVVEPYGSGLGGGGLFLLRQAGNPPQYRFIDARERAPLAASARMYQRNGVVQPDLSLNGPLAAGIPGLPAALAEISSRFGRKPLADNLVPAIRLASDGVSVDRIYIDRAAGRLDVMRKDRETARIFLQQGNLPEEWDLLRQPELANTLEHLARYGRSGFYEGETADKLVEGVRAAGGIWGLEDLRSYRVVERQPLRYPLGAGRELVSAPPPSAGGVALAQSLGILAQLPWQKAEPTQRVHYVAEALRRAYHDRSMLGDPDRIANPVQQLLSPDYLKRLAAGIDPRRATPSATLPPAPTWREGDHTTHFVVIDEQGNAVAATLSVNLPFGAAFTPPGTGVLLNDEMDDFAADIQGANAYGLTGSAANAIAPGKRPLSSMSPSFIESADELAAFGTPGGSRIPSMVLLAMLEYLDGKSVQNWVSAPRYHTQYLPDVLEHEPRAFTPAQQADLTARGYTLKDVGRAYGNQQVLLWHKKARSVDAASDPRGIGLAAGTSVHY
ncbi:gamma-glutamyltransferase [Pseudomonas panipatensis]|uniref:Glutathione hydrolase proenzyme n=1 Tax=Pseudomonas panipatensis TaxID=428992 RepID=A0A1G8J783_9PSED|nr:gamma-glutamyltransferase [Pseudomonas panipatensis]SDI26500.1 gamma-glutamyltranspeptidase / glutathione hydrolase [Pseudomonas panipatensis]SMP49638.1 gamma-glutamyltransferase 1 Threonine peptidase. MEROPS family T03 [Pseudomonas panipatensis]